MPLGEDDIQALATALQGLQTGTATVNAAAVKLPPFWSGNPEVWFKQVESVFSTRKITVQQTKFDYVVQALDNSTAEKVQSVIFLTVLDIFRKVGETVPQKGLSSCFVS